MKITSQQLKPVTHLIDIMNTIEKFVITKCPKTDPDILPKQGTFNGKAFLLGEVDGVYGLWEID